MTTNPVVTILIVDDEPNNINYLEQELEEQGYQTVSATDGTEALTKAVIHSPTVILLDVLMPGMDGFSACRALKEREDTQLIPVIIMTALGAIEDRVRGIEAGADDFLTKPVDERELLARVRTAVAHKQLIDRRIQEYTPPTRVFHKEGEFWTIAYKGKVNRVRDSKGLQHIAYLLRHPHHAIHVRYLDTAAIGQGSQEVFPEGSIHEDLGHAGEVLDAKAKAAYWQRLNELQEALAAAKKNNPRQAEQIEQEIEALSQQLRNAVGMGGHDRRNGAHIERARVNVKRAIDAALQKLETLDPELWLHLKTTIKTGTSCSYIPDLKLPSPWQL
jgi:DNA-binding response OmpR family regulator